MIVQLSPEHPSPYHIQRLVTRLEEGAVIAIPTDTCYALACLPNQKAAVDQLVQLRQLNPKKPRALIFSSIQQISTYTLLSDTNFRILKRFLPGPYCFILESNRKLPRFIGDKRRHIGVRMPNHGAITALLEELKMPLTVTSAIDPNGDQILYDPWSIEQVFGHGLASVIDCGEVPGEVSSVVKLTDDEHEVIREGLGDVTPFQ